MDKQNENLSSINPKNFSAFFFLSFTVLQLLLYLTGMILLYPYFKLWSIFLLQILVFLIPVFILSAVKGIPFKHWLQLRSISLKDFLQVSLITLGLIFFTSVLMNYFIQVPQVKYQEYQDFLMNISLGAQLFLLVFVPALCEEILFRGFLFFHLERSLGPTLAASFVTLFFVLGHLNQLTLYFLPYYLMLGSLLIFIRLWKQNLLLCIWVHLLNNFIAVIFWN
ncbi:MAG: CPBP family intramembrane metalloprotease [Deltaproteobacteria bacterium]|nr:CPBP family intramembrane metalloprotease [Deltaproteobacteria bacterium]